jgi:hypothetical protein
MSSKTNRTMKRSLKPQLHLKAVDANCSSQSKAMKRKRLSRMMKLMLLSHLRKMTHL